MRALRFFMMNKEEKVQVSPDDKCRDADRSISMTQRCKIEIQMLVQKNFSKFELQQEYDRIDKV